MKKKSTLLLILILTFLFSTTVFAGKYYSYNDVKLNNATTKTSAGTFYGKVKTVVSPFVFAM